MSDKQQPIIPYHGIRPEEERERQSALEIFYGLIGAVLCFVVVFGVIFVLGSIVLWIARR
jgi:hypothetical protein